MANNIGILIYKSTSNSFQVMDALGAPVVKKTLLRKY